MKIDFKKTFKKHLPTILTGVGCAGIVLSIVTAVTATPKTLKDIDDEICKRISESENEECTNLIKKENSTFGDYTLPTMDMIKIGWKNYIPTTVLALSSITCFILSNKINSDRYEAVLAAYNITDIAFNKYKDKVVNMLGDETNEKIHTEITKEDLDKKEPPTDLNTVFTGHGETLCYDKLSGRYMYSDPNYIKEIQNNLNERIVSGSYVSANDYYYELGLDETKMGDDIGWDIYHSGQMHIIFESMLANNHKPVCVIDHDVLPRLC